jgi:hypothetical protein
MMNCAIEPQHTSFWFRGATVVHLSRLTNCPGGFWNWTGGVNGARVAPPLSDYEKAQEMSIIVIPTSTTRRISSSDLRARRNGGASRVKGALFTASTKRISFM